MKNQGKKQAIIFDLDGTLWDSGDTVALAWNGYCAENGVDRTFTPDQCRSYCGKTLEEIAALVFPELDAPAREALLLGCCLAENGPLSERGGVLYPDEISVLEALRERYFLAVVSNCQEGYIEAFFTGNGTGYLFSDAENAGRTGLSKGENIRLVMERNGIEKALYVGDTDGDRRAAEQAGIPFIHAAYGFGTVGRADAVIRGFRELPAAVDKLLQKPL